MQSLTYNLLKFKTLPKQKRLLAFSLSFALLGLFAAQQISFAGPNQNDMKTDFAQLEANYKASKSNLKSSSKSNFNWDWLTPLNRLQQAYEKAGRYSDAEPLARENLRVVVTAFGDKEGNAASTMDDLADILVKLGKPEQLTEAEGLYKKSLDIAKKESHVYGEPAPNYGCSNVSKQLIGLGTIAMKQGKTKEAEKYFREYYNLAVKEEADRPRHIFMPVATIELAKCLVAQGQTDEAIKLYDAIVDMNVNAHCYNAKAEALNQYAELLTKLGKKDKVASLQKQARELQSQQANLNRGGLDY